MTPQDQIPITESDVESYPIDFTRLLYMLYQDLEQQLTRSDLKSQIILSTNAIFAAAAANLGLQSLDTATLSTLQGLLVVGAYAMTFISLAISVIFALNAAFPRPHISPSKAINPYYMGHITALTPEDYLAHFMGLSLQDVKKSVILQVHAKAMIGQVKYINVQRALRFLMVAIVALVMAQALRFLV